MSGVFAAAFKKKLTQKLNLTPSSKIGTKQLGDIIEMLKRSKDEFSWQAWSMPAEGIEIQCVQFDSAGLH